MKQLQIDNLKKHQRKLIKKSNTVANIAAIKEFKKKGNLNAGSSV